MVTYKGVEYETLAELCEALGISKSRVYKLRSEEGLELEAAIARVLQGRRAFTFRGKEYPSLLACCREYGVGNSAIYRLARGKGMSKAEALEALLEKRPAYEVNGKIFYTITEACQEANVKVPTLKFFRESHRCTTQEALDHYADRKPREPQWFVVKGVRYPSVAAACRALRVKPKTILHKAKQSGMSKQDVIDLYSEGEVGVTVNGVFYRSLMDACGKLGLSYGRAQSYKLKTGCTYQEAIEYAKSPYNNGNGFMVAVDGVEYKSVSECCRALGISYGGLCNYRRSSGLSWQEAITVYADKVKGDTDFRTVYKGKEYSSFAECCRDIGVGEDIVRYHMRKNNCTMEDAVQWVLQNYRRLGFKNTYTGRDGHLYGSYTCKECGRTLLITREQARDFKHSDEFCRKHEFQF